MGKAFSIYESTKESKFTQPDKISFLQNLKKDINIPQDENNFGLDKVILLMRKIRYLKEKHRNSYYKHVDLSKTVLTYNDLAPTNQIVDEKKNNEMVKYRLPLSEVGPRQKHRRIESLHNKYLKISREKLTLTHYINFKYEINVFSDTLLCPVMDKIYIVIYMIVH